MEVVLHPATEEAFRSSWLFSSIEAYVEWLEKRRAARSTITRRIPHLVRFGDFARECGAESASDLTAHVDAFVECRAGGSSVKRSVNRQAAYERELRAPVEQMLLVLGHLKPAARPPEPSFGGLAEGFFDSLREERGLRPTTVAPYRSHLAALEDHLADREADLGSLMPADVDVVVQWFAGRMALTSLGSACSALRHLLRWLFREGRLPRDLSGCVGKPQAYRLATIPRSIPWGDIERTLEGIDGNTVVGSRDFAMLVLMVLYGLRAKEIAAVTLDDIDWRTETIHISKRKCGHSTRYPLSPMAGSALLAYLRDRPKTGSRRVFIQARSPFLPVDHAVVSSRAQHHLRRAGVKVHRPGSHTLRHSCAQRLLESDFSLKVIGDYLGHRVPSSTEVYTKVAIESLREVARGNGEEVLCTLR